MANERRTPIIIEGGEDRSQAQRGAGMAQLPVSKFMRVYRSFRPWWAWALVLALATLFGVALALNAGR